MDSRIDFPKFLDADAIGLRIGVFAQIELFNQLFRQRSTATFGKEGVFGVQFHARFVVRARRAITLQTHIAGGDALDRSILVKQNFGGGETRINFNAKGLGLFAKPTADIAKADDVIALVMHLWRGWQLFRTRFAQHHELVFTGGDIQRRTAFFPVREKFIHGAWLHHSTRKGMCANLGTFFHHTDGDFFFLFLGELHQFDGRRQTGHTGTDDNHVKFHGFAFHLASLLWLPTISDCFRPFSRKPVFTDQGLAQALISDIYCLIGIDVPINIAFVYGASGPKSLRSVKIHACHIRVRRNIHRLCVNEQTNYRF